MKSFELIADITLNLIGTEQFDHQMDSVLATIGQYTQVSRVYIFIDNEDNTTSNVYEWCNTGVEPQIEELQNIPYDTIPSWKKILLHHGRVYSENIHELPDDIIAILEPQGILSIVVYPLFIQEQSKGFIGFDDCEKNRQWQESELNLLMIISGIISTAYDRKIYHEKLNKLEYNLMTFFNTIDDLIVIGSKDGQLLHTNKAVIDKLGYTEDELEKMALQVLWWQTSVESEIMVK